MSGAIQNLIPAQRRSFQITGASPAVVAGTTNTYVVAFVNAPRPKWGTLFPLSVVSQQPGAASGTWCNVINDAAFGTTFKMLRRGLYSFHANIVMNGDPENNTGNLALTLDSAALNLLATNTMSSNTSPTGLPFVVDIDSAEAAGETRLKVHGIVPITDALAGGALPLAAAGAQGVGVVRLHINDNLGSVYNGGGNLLVSLWCDYLNDLAG